MGCLVHKKGFVETGVLCTVSQKTVQNLCSKKLALAHTVYLGITKYFLINDCSLSFKMVYLM